MPGLSGREILKRIQDKHPDTPVIVISGNANAEAAEELLAMGAFAYLTKPFQLELVEDTVVRAIARRHEIRSAAASADKSHEERRALDAATQPDSPVRAESADPS
jgi:two-component system nitrogen regulation response regulator GlnG